MFDGMLTLIVWLGIVALIVALAWAAFGDIGDD